MKPKREDVANKLTPKEISHSIISTIEMNDRGFVNELKYAEHLNNPA